MLDLLSRVCAVVLEVNELNRFMQLFANSKFIFYRTKTLQSKIRHEHFENCRFVLTKWLTDYNAFDQGMLI